VKNSGGMQYHSHNAFMHVIGIQLSSETFLRLMNPLVSAAENIIDLDELLRPS